MNLKIKAISLLAGYWIIGLVFYSMYYGGTNDVISIIEFVFLPIVSIIGYLFLGIAFYALFATLIIWVICEKITRRNPNVILTVFLFSVIIPSVYWLSIWRGVVYLEQLYPNGM
ncbi:MAG: hypothetical protein M3Q80_02505 [bacterium]|nr:hypothetical protein [bacterium]